MSAVSRSLVPGFVSRFWNCHYHSVISDMWRIQIDAITLTLWYLILPIMSAVLDSGYQFFMPLDIATSKDNATVYTHSS